MRLGGSGLSVFHTVIILRCHSSLCHQVQKSKNVPCKRNHPYYAINNSSSADAGMRLAMAHSNSVLSFWLGSSLQTYTWPPFFNYSAGKAVNAIMPVLSPAAYRAMLCSVWDAESAPLNPGPKAKGSDDQRCPQAEDLNPSHLRWQKQSAPAVQCFCWNWATSCIEYFYIMERFLIHLRHQTFLRIWGCAATNSIYQHR